VCTPPLQVVSTADACRKISGFGGASAEPETKSAQRDHGSTVWASAHDDGLGNRRILVTEQG